MKTVSASFLTLQKNTSATVAKRFYYKRRYWTGSAYAWETNWTEYVKSKVMGSAAINWQLDTDQLNEFKVSNVTINVENSSNQFRADNSTGFFAPDATSPTYGYEPFWTKWQIRAGYGTTWEGTEEMVTLFTGLATEYIYDSDAKTCQIQIQGLEVLLLNSKAESIATTVTNETPSGAVNGSNKDYVTLNPGVGDVPTVTLDGATKVLGVDYTISQTNQTSVGAKVSFTVAPSVGQAVRVSYYYWPQNKQFDELVTLLLAAGGIDSGHRAVSTVTFSGEVINSQVFTSQSDWDAGTKTIIDSANSPGDISPDFTSSSIRQSQTWSTTMSGWTSLSGSGITSDGTYLNCAAGSTHSIYRAQTSVCGPWELKFTFGHASTSQRLKIEFMMGTTDGISEGRSGYRIEITTSGSIDLIRVDADGTLTSVGSTYSYTPDTSEHTLKVIRTSAGLFNVYYDGSAVIAGTDTTYTSSSYYLLRREQTFPSSSTLKLRDFVTPVSSFSSIWESGAIDMLSTPTAWNAMTISHVTGGNTLTYETKTSPDNVTYDAYVAISGGYIPQSTLRRYAKVKVTIPIDTTTLRNTIIHDITLIWKTSSAPVLLPGFTGISVYEAIQSIGEFCNYEFGFTSDEIFFFRARTAAASVMTLNQNDFISRISSMDSGYSRVYGIVRATYGAYVRETTDAGTTRTSPVARVGNARYELSADSSIQISPSTDIATGISAALFAYLSVPKRRCRMVTKFLPQLELGDVVIVYLTNNWPDKVWYYGDPEVYYGQTTIHWWGPEQQFLAGTSFRIIGARFDVDKFSSEFTLEEVVS